MLFLAMFIRKRINKSSSVSIQIISKSNGKCKFVKTIGSSKSTWKLYFLGKQELERISIQPKLFVSESDVRTRLISSVTGAGQKDGFNGILVCFNKVTNEITYESANNKLILIENVNIIKLGAHKMPVEFGIRDTPFTLHSIPNKPNAKLYLCTDGYPDQFVGQKEKSLNTNN